tara:strand:+ start:380 stop:538 length:159 start_codon:yes stop_codon:yes gene_type:complete
MFKEMDNLVNDFFNDCDETIDSLKLNQANEEEKITLEQQQEWHEQNIEEGWY